jgi:hypothetical protein
MIAERGQRGATEPKAPAYLLLVIGSLKSGESLKFSICDVYTLDKADFCNCIIYIVYTESLAKIGSKNRGTRIINGRLVQTEMFTLSKNGLYSIY